MKTVVYSLLLLLSLTCWSQIPLNAFRDLEESLTVPENITSERSVVIVHVPDKTDGVRKVGDWQKLAKEAHKAFITMGIDAVTYVNHYDLVSSENSKNAYAQLFARRKIQNLIFLLQDAEGYQLTIAPFNGEPSFLENGIKVYSHKASQLFDLLLQTGKEVRRADLSNENFLIPSKPNFAAGLSVIEKTRLDNYPGVLRRSKLSVERFGKLPIPKGASSKTVNKIESYNSEVEKKNLELEMILASYPYEYELIDKMSNEDLLRARRQFVLRSISGQAQTLRTMLDYTVSQSETDFVSVIPVMPDQTRAKPISKEAIVTKFYIRQNISKNIHVGEWDADTSWQEALKNMIGNLIQQHNVDR